MSRRTFLARMALATGVACMLVPLPGMASIVFVNPLSTMVFVDAYAAPSYNQPGVSRTTFSGAPVADAALDMYGLNKADSSAAVDANGLHAMAEVFNVMTDLGPYGMSAEANAKLNNPFILVPRAGFAGAQALIEIRYHFVGDLYDPIVDCANCFAYVDAGLWITGASGVLGNQFSFKGHSRGPNSDYVDLNGQVILDGILTAMVPVNTEIILRAGMTVAAGCATSNGQPATPACQTAARFGDTLGYTGSSPDAVDVVWGLAPALQPVPVPVPEPASALLSLAGLGLLTWLRRGRCNRA